MKDKFNNVTFGFVLIVSIIAIFYVVYDMFLRV